MEIVNNFTTFLKKRPNMHPMVVYLAMLKNSRSPVRRTENTRALSGPMLSAIDYFPTLFFPYEALPNATVI